MKFTNRNKAIIACVIVGCGLCATLPMCNNEFCEDCRHTDDEATNISLHPIQIFFPNEIIRTSTTGYLEPSQ